MTTERSDPQLLLPDPLDAAQSIGRDAARLSERLLEEAHTSWLIAESETEQTLEAWREGGSGARASRYQAYLAAIEREEAAASDLRRLHEIASRYLLRYRAS
jgi:hypothetical protein